MRSSRYRSHLGVLVLLLHWLSTDSYPQKKPIRSLANDVDIPRLGAPTEVRLGKALFFDNRLSYNQSVSCATCHNPATGFSERSAFSKGATGKMTHRNTQPLYNLAWSRKFFWDGRSHSLEEQALFPIQNPIEMNMTLDKLIERLKEVPFYQAHFEKAYGKEAISASNVARALAAFQRTIVSHDSPFDRYHQGDKTAMTPSQIRGMELFTGKGNCNVCHHGFNFTDNEFHNTGVKGDDPGRHAVDRIGRKEFDMVPYPFFATFKAFKTPGLRNVELTAPYMHNGSEKTLEEVVDHYNNGGRISDKTGIARGIKPLGLSKQDQTDLVNFMKALTGSTVDIKPVVIVGDELKVVDRVPASRR